MDTRTWRRAGYIPAGDVARALGHPPITLHRYMDKGEIAFERQGRYRFIHVNEMVRWIRATYSDRTIQNEKIHKVRDAVRVRSQS